MRVYSYVAPTLHDSTAASPGWSYFMVSAHSLDGMTIYFSRPDSGYSVDNLAPTMENLQAKLLQSGVALSWQTPESPDVVGARIYRSQQDGFQPGPSNLIAVTRDDHFFDAAGHANEYYRIEIIDDAGNTTLSDAIQPKVTAISQREGGQVPDRYILRQNYPNPFNPSTQISFGLPKTSEVQLSIYDLMGRPIRTLIQATLQAGYYELNWDGRNDAGQRVPSGTYFYKLKSSGQVLQRKMTLSK
ncbi:MAG: T9SS C-terminal target domain-containing protein [Calditrichaeota bacterium]|nr:MAG: T9SS C-terminal target domain-containing protein [Calditrichota bacterium]